MERGDNVVTVKPRFRLQLRRSYRDCLVALDFSQQRPIGTVVLHQVGVFFLNLLDLLEDFGDEKNHRQHRGQGLIPIRKRHIEQHHQKDGEDRLLKRTQGGLAEHLFLERPRWESTVYVDDKDVGTCNSLVAPHEYELARKNLEKVRDALAGERTRGESEM